MPTQVAIAVVERAGSYLIGLRPAGAPLAGLWEFPGGKVHPDETPAAAAARECLEEAGLAVDAGPLLARIDHQYAHGAITLHFFVCTPRAAEPVAAARFRWVPRGELAQYEFPPANAPVLAALARGAVSLAVESEEHSPPSA